MKLWSSFEKIIYLIFVLLTWYVYIFFANDARENPIVKGIYVQLEHIFATCQFVCKPWDLCNLQICMTHELIYILLSN